jgi:hypothetical protein
MARALPAVTDHDQAFNRPARASRHLLRGWASGENHGTPLPRAIDGQPKPRNLKERSKIVERLAVTIVLVAHTVAYLQEFKDHTAIHFVGGLSAEGRAMIVGVREKPDTIHLANPLHAA